MNYSEALKLFGFTNNFTKEELKKRYLELSKKYHPDLNGDEEMMKKVNNAYEVLKKGGSYEVTKSRRTQYKQENYDEFLMYYNNLRRKLDFYVSKTVYLPDTLEYKYAKAIEDVVKAFSFSKEKLHVDFKYNVAIGSIKDLFKSYKNEVLKNISEAIICSFGTINSECSFDEYVKKVSKIKVEYEEIDKQLNNIILSTKAKIRTKMMEDIIAIKETIIKDILDKKITIKDGIYRLQTEIKAKIISKATIKDHYKTILEVLNSKPFFSEDKLYKKHAYELYISSDCSCYREPEIILKKSENKTSVFFLKKNINTKTVEEFCMIKEKFCANFCKLSDLLATTNYDGDISYIRFHSGAACYATLLYYFGPTGLILTEDDEVLAINYYQFSDGKSPVEKNPYTKKYADKQLLYDKIYNSFLEREEEIKLKREKK